ncbi:type IV pilin protein [Vreelandella aquamarina]|jgi:type IV pilus assembly protein PilE|uniref:type IV pilin protein n=1 Tax=Halomonadaceae TaxID=28256 RepID=UPI0015522406|nr:MULTISPECIES: type IV pilin protein [Halomonas]MCC4289016.1 prepilin-type N-terminal cleavage/methylation domain-containing protein [Halomonas meridiana]MCC4292362.1 prepilin-type N-terminal cleavage/methylation domain-containing protein [Halomonas axialensis]MCD1652959.1 prepilin-type N-terminal cleavage/methylation domain-containing protein [Halomonas axialensis]MCD2089278.1 prepilin-type N-terminal cleavage/methylation domain-containing protein [Halomonas meridiana]MCF2914430.1 prepilin-|tara:strand:+ start:672 stop:1115 length:444 start_codon:yes stop_codon:yes gene_type:complete
MSELIWEHRLVSYVFERRAGDVSKHQRGFTLIELLIAVVIIGIIASIAYPSYTRYVERSQRAEAKAVLMETASILERCYTNNYSYENCTAAEQYLDSQSNDLYMFDTIGPSAGSYTVSATSEKSRVKTGCETLELHSNGDRTPRDCW